MDIREELRERGWVLNWSQSSDVRDCEFWHKEDTNLVAFLVFGKLGSWVLYIPFRTYSSSDAADGRFNPSILSELSGK